MSATIEFYKEQIKIELLKLIKKLNDNYDKTSKIFRILNNLEDINNNEDIKFITIKEAEKFINMLYEYRSRYNFLVYKKQFIDIKIDKFINKHKLYLCCSNPQHCGHINWPFNNDRGYSMSAGAGAGAGAGAKINVSELKQSFSIFDL